MRRNEKITKLMTPSPVSVQAGQSLAEAAALMRGNDFHHLPVVEGSSLVGILSTTDLMKASYPDADDPRDAGLLDRSVAIRDLMQPPQHVEDTQTIRDAVGILAEGRFHSLPVVSGGTLVGIVTSTDLLRYLQEQY